MEVIVEDYGDSEVKERYRVDQHIALTDAWCLAKLCISQSEFQSWLEDLTSLLSSSPGPSVVRHMIPG